jgi:rhodanese-related sulfurtransferase
MTEIEIPEVDVAEARARMAAGAMLIDVREQNEWDEARIPGATLKPMSQLNDWWQELPKDREIILQCRSGARSGRVVGALVNQAGMTNVVNMAGGIIAWSEAGYDVEI